MDEKREIKRRHLIYYLRVFDRKTDQLLGHLVNITPQGIMLISEESLATDTTFQLRMKLPSALQKIGAPPYITSVEDSNEAESIENSWADDTFGLLLGEIVFPIVGDILCALIHRTLLTLP